MDIGYLVKKRYPDPPKEASQKVYVSILADFRPVFGPLETSRGGKKVF